MTLSIWDTLKYEVYHTHTDSMNRSSTKGRIVCTVTTDLSFDQRMNRICHSLAQAGYEVELVGRKLPHSLPLKEKLFRQKRLFCFFTKGKLFYAEYAIRLFFYLLTRRCDVYCAIDLDTILSVLYASKLKNKKRVYDAHELFCEMDEITSRPVIYKVWRAIERHCIPQFPHGYTIGPFYAREFEERYGVSYTVVRNATVLKPLAIEENASSPYILYQGAVNEGRCFETLIPAMQFIDLPLVVCGKGNFFEQAVALSKEYQVEHKIQFKGYIEPEQLTHFTKHAYIGITLFTSKGKSNYYSMANRYFDYMHYAIPQLCVNYPEYKHVNQQFEVAALIDDTSPEAIAQTLQKLISDKTYYQHLRQQCILARETYCWQAEEKRLIAFYDQLLHA